MVKEENCLSIIESTLPEGFHDDPTRGRACDYKCPRCNMVPVYGLKMSTTKAFLVLGCVGCRTRWIAPPIIDLKNDSAIKIINQV